LLVRSGVATRRWSVRTPPPWTEVHGYHRCIATRCLESGSGGISSSLETGLSAEVRRVFGTSGRGHRYAMHAGVGYHQAAPPRCGNGSEFRAFSCGLGRPNRETHARLRKMWVMTRTEVHGYHRYIATRCLEFGSGGISSSLETGLSAEVRRVFGTSGRGHRYAMHAGVGYHQAAAPRCGNGSEFRAFSCGLGRPRRETHARLRRMWVMASAEALGYCQDVPPGQR